MQLPWVARMAVDLLAERVTALESALADERSRYERLVERMAEMQRAGFVAAQPSSPPQKPPRLPASVELAIADHMDPKGAAGRETARLARARLKQGDPEESVVAWVHRGAGEA